MAGKVVCILLRVYYTGHATAFVLITTHAVNYLFSSPPCALKYSLNHYAQIFLTNLIYNLLCVPSSQTLIEANVDVKTTDGYLLRLFCIGFTKRQPNQIKKTAYAKSSQCRQIRKKMVETMNREISGIDLKETVNKL